MKTIATSLPIYDLKAKQCYERARKAKTLYQSSDPPVPIICPRHRLPAFQWNAEAADMGDVLRVEMFGLKYSAAETTLATSWGVDAGWDTFTHAGLNITTAENAAGVAYAQTTETFALVAGEQLVIKGVCTLADGAYPTVFITSSQVRTLVAGYNEISITATRNVTSSLTIYINGHSDFSFAGVSITKVTDQTNYKDLTDWFPTLPYESNLTTDTYYSYDGDVLNFIMPEGVFYLKITMEEGFILYSDWFKVDCVYDNLITDPDALGTDYDTFTLSGTIIVSAINNAAGAYAHSELISVRNGESITFITYLTLLAGELPQVYLVDPGVAIMSNQVALAAGLNEITLTATGTGDYTLHINNNNTSTFAMSEIVVYREYSEKYLTINFSNTCDLGDILYDDGLLQTIWFESETMEPSFPQEEEGINNGDNRFIRAFARQIKKYVARTKEMPAFMVDVFNRMKLHDTVSLIDLVGDENTVYNLEVEHEWLDNDKYYTIITLTFDYDEAFVVAGCCNNLT